MHCEGLVDNVYLATLKVCPFLISLLFEISVPNKMPQRA